MPARKTKMYRINEIFYSLQGEGHNTGRAAVFVRFAGCNLRCPFCDTEFDTYHEMTSEQIFAAIAPYPTRFVVLTGGEPTLQVDAHLVDQFHQHGYEVAMESNGTRPAPPNIDWLTVSPKTSGERQEVRGLRQEARGERTADELKIVFDENTDPEAFLPPLRSQPSTLRSAQSDASLAKNPQPSTLISQHSTLNSQPSTLNPPLGAKRRFACEELSTLLYLQPCDTGDATRNATILSLCIDYIKQHPQWRLSLQTHKLTGIK